MKHYLLGPNEFCYILGHDISYQTETETYYIEDLL